MTKKFEIAIFAANPRRLSLVFNCMDRLRLDFNTSFILTFYSLRPYPTNDSEPYIVLTDLFGHSMESETDTMHQLLIVGGDPATALIIKEALAGHGYNIAGHCVTGKEAVTHARKSRPCVALMDIVLPGDLDGIETAKIFKDELDIPSVFISENSPKQYIHQGKALAPLAYIQKPFTQDQLRAAVDFALHKKRIEGREKAIQKNFEFLVLNATDGIVIGDKNGRHLFANEAAARIIGYSVSELLGMKTTDVLHPDDIPMKLERDQNRFANQPLQEHFEARAIRKDGKTINVEISSATTLWQNQPAVVAIIRDISDRKRTEEQMQFQHNLMEMELDKRKSQLKKMNKQLREQLKKQIQTKQEILENHTKWQGLIEAMNDGFVIADPLAKVTYVNPKLYEMTGFTEDELVGKNWKNLIPKQFHSFLKEKRKKRRKGISDSYQTRLIKKDGTLIDVIHSVTPLFDDKDNYQGVLLVVTDITDLKKAQAALERREERLNEVNLTLRALLKRTEAEIAKIKAQMLHNTKSLTAPLLNALKKGNFSEPYRIMVRHLEQVLDDLLSPFAKTLSSELYSLSPAELRIARMVRDGHSSKTIARMLDLSPRTVEVHRTRIRKKLKLSHEEINLRTFLQTLDP